MDDNYYAYTPRSGAALVIYYSRTLSRGSMSEAHHHPECEMIALLTGSGWCRIGEERIAMSAGNIYLLPPGVSHIMGYADDQPHTMYHVYFRPEIIQSIREEFSLDLSPLMDEVRSLPLSDEVRGRLDGAVLGSTGGLIDRAVRSLLIKCVLLSVARELGMDRPGSAPAVDHPIIREIVTYIDRRYAEEISVEQLGSMFSLNTSYLCRLFRRETGMTVMDYINKVRIEHACRMMRETDESISHIALRTGYNSTAYFDRRFRQHTGVTPTQYLALNHRK